MCALENFTFDLDVPKSIPFNEYANQSSWKLCKPMIFGPITQPRTLALKWWSV